MSRNSSGTYSLYTPGNPVVTGTTISSTWANNTFSDIATALTDSLSRSGQGGMSAPLQLANGLIGAPALTWATETTGGLYRAGAGDFRFAVTGTDVLKFQSTGVTGTFSGKNTFVGPWSVTNPPILIQDTTTAMLQWNVTGNALNEKRWRMYGTGTSFYLSAASDIDTGDATVFQAIRSGFTVTTVNFMPTTLQYNGVEVGYRQLARTDFTANTTASDTVRAGLYRYTGAGGHTLSFDIASAYTTGALFTVINDGLGTLTVGGTLTHNWMNGAGVVPPTGARSLARGGVMTVWVYAPASGTYLWGTGIS